MIKIIERKIETEEFIALRESVEWGIPAKEALENGLINSLYSVCAEIDDEVVGMARVVGDGSICFYIQDVIVKPEFQKMGIGKRMMEKVMNYINNSASSGAVVGLMSAKGKEEFYEKYGFWKRPTEKFGYGMMQFWERKV